MDTLGGVVPINGSVAGNIVIHLVTPTINIITIEGIAEINIMMKAKLTTGGLFVRIDSLRVMKGNILSAPIFRYTVIHNYDHQQHPYSRSSYLI